MQDRTRQADLAIVTSIIRIEVVSIIAFLAEFQYSVAAFRWPEAASGSALRVILQVSVIAIFSGLSDVVSA
jgi:hypothetical protein